MSETKTTADLDVCGDCTQASYCRAHEQCHYTKTRLRNPDGTPRRWVPAAEVLPTAVWSGSFSLFGVEVKCHTLSDGQRIIEADSMHNLLEAMGAPSATIDHDLEEFTKWRRG